MLELVQVNVEINGAVYRCPWGETTFPLAPGRYQVTVSCPWMFYRHLGRNSIMVDVPPGQPAIVQWTAPPFAFQKGKIHLLTPNL
jgi:hypothetical protein